MVTRFGMFGLLFAVVSVTLLSPLGAAVAADSWQGKVVNVIDGATLDVAKPDGQVERVRLFAVKVPAPGQAKADEAQKRTASWCYQDMIITKSLATKAA